jgi:hypothetical protein
MTMLNQKKRSSWVATVTIVVIGLVPGVPDGGISVRWDRSGSQSDFGSGNLNSLNQRYRAVGAPDSTRLEAIVVFQPSCWADERDSTEGVVVPVYERPCSDSLTVAGNLQISPVPSENRTRLLALVSFIVMVSRPIVPPGENALDLVLMRKRSVALPPNETHILIDTSLVVSERVSLSFPRLGVSLWRLNPLVRIGYDKWIPTRVCAQVTVLRSAESPAEQVSPKPLARHERTACLWYGLRGE